MTTFAILMLQHPCRSSFSLVQRMLLCLCYVSNAGLKPYIGSMYVHDVYIYVCSHILIYACHFFLSLYHFMHRTQKTSVALFLLFFFVREHHGVNPHTEFRTHNRINTHFIYNLHSIPPSTKIPKPPYGSISMCRMRNIPSGERISIVVATDVDVVIVLVVEIKGRFDLIIRKFPSEQ